MVTGTGTGTGTGMCIGTRTGSDRQRQRQSQCIEAEAVGADRHMHRHRCNYGANWPGGVLSQDRVRCGLGDTRWVPRPCPCLLSGRGVRLQCTGRERDRLVAITCVVRKERHEFTVQGFGHGWAACCNVGILMHVHLVAGVARVVCTAPRRTAR